MGKLWSIKDIEILKENFPSMDNKKISELLHRSEISIKGKSHKLSLLKTPINQWEEQEIKYLRNNYMKLTARQISEELNKSLYTIEGKIHQLGLSSEFGKRKEIIWKGKDDQYLRENYSVMSVEDISIYLKRTVNSVYARAAFLKIRKPTEWTLSKLEILKRKYSKTKICELVKILNINSVYILQKASQLKLKKDPLLIRAKNSDMSVLLINKLETFYWIGYLLADGCFYDNRLISVSDHETSDKHLKKLSVFLKTKLNKNKIFSGYRNYSKKLVNINIISCSDKNLVPKIMKKFDIQSRKTYNPPDFSKYNFTDNQFLSLIIGFIDGDGCICDRKNSSGVDIRLALHSSWINNLTFINNFLNKLIKDVPSNSARITNRGFSDLMISKQKIIIMMKNFIVKNNLPNMERKWDKIKL
jgi:hypothetical protein